MSSDVILKPNQPQKFEGRNIRTPKRSGALNDLYLVQFEVTREAWEALETVPKSALLEGVIWWNDGDEDGKTPGEQPTKRAKKEPKPTGIHGWFWQSMYKSGLFNNLELAEALNSDGNPETTKSALKLLMEVESLSFLDPVRFEAWCAENELHAIVTLCRQAHARVKGEV